MTCAPCLKGRAALKSAATNVVSGNVGAALAALGDLGDALREKAESMRVRERLFGRR